MDDKALEQIAFTNLPKQICPLTGQGIVNASVMHRDLSDWWPSSLSDMRDDRIANLMIVERDARDRYYDKLKNTGIVLSFSGGLDSATVLHWCARLFGSVHCLIFDYGQRHKIEIERAVSYLEVHGDELNRGGHEITWQVVDMSPINKLAASSLTRTDMRVPTNQSLSEMASRIPSTFVPGRNLYFMTAIAQSAFKNGWRHIAMGVNALDYSGYPDCRPEFVAAMREALSLGVFNGHDIGVHAPLMMLNKRSIIRLGIELGVKYEDTHSCYNGLAGGCGECDSCLLRRAAFNELGLQDPSIAKWIG